MTKRLTLKADAGDLPLGWEAGERLAGQKREGPYKAGTRALTGKALDKRLAELGPGRKIVTIEGRYQPSDEDTVEELRYFSRRTEVGLTLDARSLGYQVHELVRRFRESEKARANNGDTPKEAYVTAIHIRTAPGPIGERRVVTTTRVPKGKRKPVTVTKVATVRVRYFDTERGKFVSRDTWERSRRAIRARTPAGKRAKPGRYVKRTYST